MSFSKRLQHLIDEKKIKQISVANGIKESEQQVSKWISGVICTPRRTTIQKLSDFFGCDINWLATGKGQPFTLQNIGIKERSSKISELNKIPLLGKVPAGIADTLSLSDFSDDETEYISVPNSPPGSYALRVSGESMEPGIKHGDFVLFVIDREPQSGDVVVVNDEYGDSMIKRYKVKGDKALLVSDNPSYPTYTPNSHYRIMGVVVGGWRELKI